jgi:hypothetical protein
MNTSQADLPDGRRLGPRFYVRVQRTGKPPTPWTWTIHGQVRDDAVEQSVQFYRSAEEAWESGRAMLNHLHPARDRA